MKYYHLNVAGLERELPICPLNEDLQIAGFVIIGDPELSRACAKALLAKVPEYDYIFTAEAKGIPLAHDMALANGDKKYICARKKPKLYMSGVFEVTVQSITTEGEQKLYLDTAEAELIKGKRLLIVDDVISTGKSLDALVKLATQAGAHIIGKAAILAEGDAADRDDIIYLEKLPLLDKNGNPL
ncbi:MAG: phosphoribosyltransferase family protein [Clostridia bacterium]|nr:phosphoribosyltransferase family protein [Clostridia bacterium]